MKNRCPSLLIAWLLLVPFMLAAAPVWAADTPSFSAPGDPVTSLTLEGAVNRGLEVNSALRASYYQQRAAEERHKAARGELLPRITANIGSTHVYNRSADEYSQDYLDQRSNTYSMRLSQPLFAGFTAVNTWRRAGVEAELEEVRKEMHALDLAHEVQSLFLELLRVRQDLLATESAVERLENQLAAAEAWFEVDMRPRLGVLQTMSELESARNRVLVVANTERSLRVRLAALLALPDADVDYDETILDHPPVMSFGEDHLLALARANRPDLRYARLDVQRALSGQRLARGRLAPRVSLDMDYTRQDRNFRTATADDLEREYWSIGINLQWELFSGGRDYYQMRGAGHELASAEASLRDTKNHLMSEVRQAWLAYVDAEARIGGAAQALEAAREAFAVAEERYRASLGTTLEVLDTQAQLTNAESELNQTRVERIHAIADIYRVVGMLQPDLRMRK